MQPLSFDILEPHLMEALSSDDALRCWERLRLLRRPTPLAALAREMEMEVGRVAPLLDLLESAKMVRRLRAHSGRRAICYETTTDRIVVVAAMDDAEAKRRFQTLGQGELRRDEAKLARAKPLEERCRGEWFFHQIGEVVVSDDEMKELQRRVYEVSRYLSELSERARRANLPAATGLRQLVQLQVMPLHGESAPMPEIHLITPDAARDQARGRIAPSVALGKREREIARLLQAGMSRAEIAARLGIGRETVATYCKRLYAKLGISRAMQLTRVSLDTEPSHGRKPRGARNPDA